MVKRKRKRTKLELQLSKACDAMVITLGAHKPQRELRWASFVGRKDLTVDIKANSKREVAQLAEVIAILVGGGP